MPEEAQPIAIEPARVTLISLKQANCTAFSRVSLPPHGRY